MRRERPEWFGAEAAYAPLDVAGAKSEYVIAYLRGDSVATVVPRLTMKMAGAWRRTTVSLPEGRWRNRLTDETVDGGRVAVETLWKEFPVALLVSEEVGEGQRGCMSSTVWAPRVSRVAVKVGDALYPMSGPDERGWWKAVGGGARGPERTMGFCWMMIRLLILIRAVAWQPHGVHGASRLYDQTAFAWQR